MEGVVKPGQYPRYLELDVSPDTRVALLNKPGPEGEPVSERIEAREEDGWTYLPVDVSEDRFLLRYYFNPFDRESGERTFTYELTTNEVLPEFHIIIQKPVAAQYFRHSLAEAEEQVDEFGLTYYQQHIHGLQPGASFSVAVEYDNPTQTLTLTELQSRMERKQAEGGAGQRAAGGRPLNLLTVLLVVALLAGCLFIAFRLWSGRKVAPKEGPAKLAKEKQVCSNCGAPRRPGARFCPSCSKGF
ncbi:MAG: zinc ribbon domain-containing protein [Planctomycetes bacterium]|nr:zinc ribbon domain-containing protein [Planctomycetota bacterium]